MGVWKVELFSHVELLLRAMTAMAESLLIGRHPFFLIGCTIYDLNKYIVAFITLIFRKELKPFPCLNSRIELNERERVLFVQNRTFRFILPHLQIDP